MKLVVIVFSICLITLTVAQNLVLLGGNLRDDNDVIWNTMVQLAGGKGVAQIGVISASQYSTVEGDKVIKNFVNVYGAKSAIAIPVTRFGARETAIANLVKQQTGIFIVEDTDGYIGSNFMDWASSLFLPHEETPGGVVCYEVGSFYKRKNLLHTLRPYGVETPVLAAIKTVLNNGGMVAGNVAFMSRSTVILDGDSISALTTGTRFVAFPQTPLVYRRLGGLALLDINYVTTSRLSEKGREVLLIRTLIENKVSRGIGIDENTALVVKNPLTAPVGTVTTATGSTTGVFYADVTNIPSTSITRAYYKNVPCSYFTMNDTVDLNSGDATYASWKSLLTGFEYFENAIVSKDILSLVQENQWRLTARQLVDCKETNVTSYSPRYFVPIRPYVRVVLDRTQSIAYGNDIPLTKTYLPSYRNVLATIKVLGIV